MNSVPELDPAICVSENTSLTAGLAASRAISRASDSLARKHVTTGGSD
jgi:hypothetical protein